MDLSSMDLLHRCYNKLSIGCTRKGNMFKMSALHALPPTRNILFEYKSFVENSLLSYGVCIFLNSLFSTFTHRNKRVEDNLPHWSQNGCFRFKSWINNSGFYSGFIAIYLWGTGKSLNPSANLVTSSRK